MYIHIYMCICTHMWHISTCKYMLHTYTHVHIYTYVSYIYVYIYIHTHAQSGTEARTNAGTAARMEKAVGGGWNGGDDGGRWWLRTACNWKTPNVCVFVYVCGYVCMCICVCVWVCVCVCMNVHMYTYEYICI